jgi:hypothetical protein
MDANLTALALTSDANDPIRIIPMAGLCNKAYGFSKYLSENPAHRFRPNNNQKDKRPPSAPV